MVAVKQASKKAAKKSANERSPWIARAAGAAVIIFLTALAYYPALQGKFVWDDDSWTTSISWLVRDLNGLKLMWTTTSLQQYYPLTGTTFWIDYHLWGFWTLPYHVESIVLHMGSALLFWALLRRLKVPGAWLAGAIFALHPVMVESVAWITERKNVLSMVLYLSALLAYGRFVSFWSEEEKLSPKRWVSYGLASGLFLAALLAKTTAFSFPAVILLICWWKRGRIRWRQDVVPTLPLFVVAIGFCAWTGWLEKNHVGAKGPEWAISFPQRCLIAGRVFWFYIGKLLWPANLSFVYIRWHPNPYSWRQWLFPISALGVLLALWLARRRIGRGPIAAAFFYLGTLFPSLGFMNAYFMRYSFVCDHWAYLSSLSLIASAAVLMTHLAAHFRSRASLYGMSAVLLPILAILTWEQCGIYKDLETLWRDTLTKNPTTWLALNNLGIVLRNENRLPEAIQLYEESLRYDPNYAETHNNLGVALKAEGKTQEAIEQYLIAIRIKPDYADAYDNYGNALRAQGKLSDAVAQIEQSLRLEPDWAEAHYDLGIALTQQGKIEEADDQYRQALDLDPDYFEARCNFAINLMQLGNFSAAVEQYNEAVRIRPNSSAAHNDLAVALSHMGRLREAISQWELAVRIKPNYADAAHSLAWLLATLAPEDGGDPAQAVALAEHACDLTGYQRPDYVDTLAAAYASAGRFDDAIVTAQKAIDLARSAGDSQFAGEIQSRLDLYRNGEPARQFVARGPQNQ
jgi:tetratricopeptide (TPR) repeat protein